MLVINSINFKDICIYELLIYSKFEKLHNGGLGTHDLPNTFEDLFPTNSYNLRSHIGGTSSKSKMGLASKNVATFVLIVMVIICITCTSVLGLFSIPFPYYIFEFDSIHMKIVFLVAFI